MFNKCNIWLAQLLDFLKVIITNIYSCSSDLRIIPAPHKNNQNNTLPPNCSDHDDQNIPTFVITSLTHDQVVLVIRWIFILWIHDLGMDSPQSATYIFYISGNNPTNQSNKWTICRIVQTPKHTTIEPPNHQHSSSPVRRMTKSSWS